MTHIPIPLSVSDHPLESMPQTLTHFSWIPKHLSGLLRQLKRAQTTRPQTCQKKQHTQGQILKNKSPWAPKPLPSILSGPLSCASEKMCDEKGQTKKRNERQEEQRLKRIRGNVQGEIQQPRWGGETCVFFIFPTHGLNQKWNQTKTNGLKLNFTQWNETKY